MSSPVQEIRRARKQALILGSIMVVTLCSVIYAIGQKERADKLEEEVQRLNQQIHSIEMSRDIIH